MTRCGEECGMVPVGTGAVAYAANAALCYKNSTKVKSRQGLSGWRPPPPGHMRRVSTPAEC